MKQQCHIWSIWLTWLALPVLALVGFLLFGWPAAIATIVAAVAAQVVYIRNFPKLAVSMGYGTVEDVAAVPLEDPAPEVPAVTLYTASACPFCPLVRNRLLALQKDHGFSLTELDVTFRPGLVTAKGLRAVPSIEVDGRVHPGNLTSAELLRVIAGRENVAVS